MLSRDINWAPIGLVSCRSTYFWVLGNKRKKGYGKKLGSAIAEDYIAFGIRMQVHPHDNTSHVFFRSLATQHPSMVVRGFT